MTLLERLAVAIASLALTVLLVALLSGFFSSRDTGALAGLGPPPGERVRDLGNVLLKPGRAAPRYDSNPPTSGAHVPEQVTRDQAGIDDNQLLTALAAGDVVILYPGAAPPPTLAALAGALAPPFSPALARAGDAVILAKRPGTTAVIALAWAHMLTAGSATDPRLRAFAGFWLGRGAPRRR